MKFAAACAVLAACSSHAPTATPPSPRGPAAPADAAIDAPPVSQEQTLAAIQHAMNELDEGVQGCWAASAARERFDIEGDLKLHIDIGDRDGGGAVATTAFLSQDGVHDAGFTSCVIAMATNYHWAPPLYGQSIELPFRVRHPVDGQNVIDRRLVPWNGQGKVSVAVLLDEANSGNEAASIFELAVQAGGTTEMRTAEREEVWYFLGPATVTNVGSQGPYTVAAGDMAYVRKGGAREIRATAGDVHAVVVMLPGGREGTGRAGALPTPALTTWRSAPVGWKIYPASTAKTFGPATIYMEPTITGSSTFAAEVLTLAAGNEVAEHVHAKETELLYVLEGSGTMTVDGTALAVGPTSVVQIPPNTKHAFKATENFRAVQLYTPAGPEQRFKEVSIQAILAGDMRAAGKLMRDIDDRVSSARAVLQELYPHTGRAYYVGVTGNPGAGKSTLVDALIAHYRAAGERVGVVAVDPTSPFSGGAILGDRIRMQRHATDPGVFIRSVATRGHLGGLSRSTFAIAHVLDAMGFDRILIETVGVGQDEVDVMQAAHTTVVVSVPGLGDEIQAIKGGLLEVADVLVVNKADREGADRTERDLVHMLGLRTGADRPPVRVVRTIATRGVAAGSGVTDLATAIEEHRAAAWSGPGAERRAIARASAHVGELVRASLMERAEQELAERQADLDAAIRAKRADPWALADELLDEIVAKST